MDELSQEDREKWTAKLIPHTQKVFDYSYSDAAWKYIPSIFLITERDKAIPVNFQEMSAQLMSAKMIRLNMGHGAHLAQTKELANAISNALDNADA